MTLVRKRDVFLIVALLATSALLLFFCYPPARGTAVEVSVDGVVTARYTLSENCTTLICGVGGENLLVISEGTASISEADCPDRLCCRSPQISRAGETIVCLPHRVVVRVIDADETADTWLFLPRREEVTW